MEIDICAGGGAVLREHSGKVCADRGFSAVSVPAVLFCCVFSPHGHGAHGLCNLGNDLPWACRAVGEESCSTGAAASKRVAR